MCVSRNRCKHVGVPVHVVSPMHVGSAVHVGVAVHAVHVDSAERRGADGNIAMA